MILTRFAYLETGTIGRLTHEGKTYFTVERPWLNNKPNISCIPEGFYTVERHQSGKFNDPEVYIGDSWEIQQVPDRTYILFHVANTASDVLGCIGLGDSVYPDLRGIGSSRSATARFYNQTKGLDKLEIEILSGALK